jgi:hypothetical protein
MNESFNAIRAFDDEDVSSVIAKLLNDQQFSEVISSLSTPFQKLFQKLPTIKTISAFQAEISYPFAEWIIQNTIKILSFSGLEKLNKNQPYLFISNHRDIVMDPLLINYLLYKNGFRTTQIGIGNNLLIFPWIENIVRLNKSFVVKRNIKGKELKAELVRLSDYIAHVLLELGECVWIAQREGRAKDGIDETQISLLKMLFLATPSFNAEIKIKNYSLVPVSINYEFDPCDALKAIELHQKAQGLCMKKTPEKDLLHMKKGLLENKGHVHIHFSEPITLPSLKNKHDFQQLKSAIDKEIHANYKLFSTHLFAYKKFYSPTFKLTPDEEYIADNYFKKQKERYQLNDEQFTYLLLPYANQAKLYFLQHT